MSAESLWRGPAHRLPVMLNARSVQALGVGLTDEVEVWPAGDRTQPIDRNRVRAVVVAALVDVGEPFSKAQVNRIANSVMLLLHGQGDETR